MPIRPPNTHILTHSVPTWLCMVRVSSSLKNPVFVPSALKKSVLMVSFFFLCGCVFQSLYFDHSHYFLHWKDSLNYLNLTPPLLCLSVPLSFSPFIHLLNRPNRQADLFTGVHSVVKVFKHRWMWGGRSPGGGVDTWYPLYSSVSNSQYTLSYNRNTKLIYPPCFITSWLRLIYATVGLSISQHFS